MKSPTNLIESPELKDQCPCDSKQTFGSCCGFELPCDCNSKLTAGECCYLKTEESEPTQKRAPSTKQKKSTR